MKRENILFIINIINLKSKKGKESLRNIKLTYNKSIELI